MAAMVKLILSVFVCQLAGFIGSLFTRSSLTTWYQTLKKPFFMPPGWLFSPVWITLYLIMGISLFLVWNKKTDKANLKKTALLFFLLQLIFNNAWPAVFFGMQNIALGVIVILALWLLILITTIKFYQLSKIAGILFVPYLFWVAFATALNIAILVLN